MERRTSLFDNGLIWFGAGVSLAEILTGTYFSTLGFGKGFAAIIAGHVIGCVASVFSRRHRRKEPFKRYGDSKKQLWQQGRSVFRPVKCLTVSRLDGYYDL